MPLSSRPSIRFIAHTQTRHPWPMENSGGKQKDIAVTGKQSWGIQLLWSWRWKPTSSQELELAERKMLEKAGIHYQQKMIEIRVQDSLAQL